MSDLFFKAVFFVSLFGLYTHLILQVGILIGQGHDIKKYDLSETNNKDEI